jgi:hypothetical protein
MSENIDSTSDDRIRNNAMRHTYKVLSDNEKAQMLAVKDQGLVFYNLIGNLQNATGSTRELALAKTKIEEAVMWAVKHITG